MSISGIVSKNFPTVYGICLKQFKRNKSEGKNCKHALFAATCHRCFFFCYIVDVENWEMHLSIFYRSCVCLCMLFYVSIYLWQMDMYSLMDSGLYT